MLFSFKIFTHIGQSSDVLLIYCHPQNPHFGKKKLFGKIHVEKNTFRKTTLYSLEPILRCYCQWQFATPLSESPHKCPDAPLDSPWLTILPFPGGDQPTCRCQDSSVATKILTSKMFFFWHLLIWRRWHMLCLWILNASIHNSQSIPPKHLCMDLGCARILKLPVDKNFPPTKHIFPASSNAKSFFYISRCIHFRGEDFLWINKQKGDV